MKLRYQYGTGDDEKSGTLHVHPNDWLVTTNGLSVPGDNDFWHIAAGTALDLEVPERIVVGIVRVFDAHGVPNKSVMVYIAASTTEMMARLKSIYGCEPQGVKVHPDSGTYKITNSIYAYIGKFEWGRRNRFMNLFENPVMIELAQIPGIDTE